LVQFIQLTKWAFGISLQLLSETFLILRRMQQDTVTNFHRSPCKHLLFLPDLNETSICERDFWKMLKYQISRKSEHRELNCSM